MRQWIGGGPGRVLLGLLLTTLVLLCCGIAAKPAEAAWSGWGGDKPTVQEACESWRQFRDSAHAYIVKIEFKYDSQGQIHQADCHIAFDNLILYYEDVTNPSCPAGHEVNGNNASGCQPVIPRRALGNCETCNKDVLAALGDPSVGPTAGNPISLSTGNKFQAATDYRSGGAHPLTFKRFYNSQSKVTGALGPAWRHSYERRLVLVSSSRTDYHAIDGRVFVFNKVGSVWQSVSDVALRLASTDDGWTVTDEADRAEMFDSSGRLLSVRYLDGYQQVVEHHGPDGKISLVYDSHGRKLVFSYNGSNLLASVTDGQGREVVYRYGKSYAFPSQPSNLLELVIYPDDTALDEDDNPRVEYLYEDARFPAGLTGIVDEAGNRYATWIYDEEGRAITSEHAGATELYSVVYNTDGSRKVTNPLGQETVYHFTPINGLPRVSQIDRLAGPSTSAATASLSYDTNGFLSSTTDWNGNVTSYSYDSRGLLESRTEAVGEAEERTVTTTWHNDFRLPTQIASPGHTTDLSYDSDGLLLTRTLTDTTSHALPYATNGQSRTWTYAYSVGGENPDGTPPLPEVPLSVTNPNAETGDTTGWTVTEGAFAVRSASPTPSQGSYYFFGGAAASSRMHQDIALPSATWGEVDSGLRSVAISWRQSSDGQDQGAVIVEFVDSNGQPTGGSFESRRHLPSTWLLRSEELPIPANTRTIRITLRALRQGGTVNNAYFDGLTARLVQQPPYWQPLPLVNSDAETGDLSGWSSEAGAFEIKSTSPSATQGDHYFYAGLGNGGTISQVLTIPADSIAAIDAGTSQIDFFWWQNSANGNDLGLAVLVFQDGSGQQIGAPVASAALAPTVWSRRKLSGTLPPGTRGVHIKLRGLLVEGSYSDAFFDMLSASLVRTDRPLLPLPRHLVSVDGPRSGVSDTTAFAYDELGELEATTNALGHVSSILARTASGLPLTLVDGNGVETDLVYDSRDRLSESRLKGGAGDAVTRYSYDDRGLLTAVALPDGSRLFYEYDSAKRLTAIANDLDERIEYTLDAMGNRTAEVVRSDSGTIVRSQSQVFDELGRLLQRIGAGSQVFAYGYDAEGNQVSITDPLSGMTAQAFDALDRLVQQTDPLSGLTGYAYDAQDNLISVTDPRGLATTYTYNGFGEVIQLESPDTGTTVFTLDAAGNVVSQSDARGVVTAFTYDALNRPLTRSYPASPAEDVTYSYDDAAAGNRGIGRLTTITDDSGTTSLVYDDYRNLVEETRTIDGVAYTTGYSYDLAGNLLQMTYPDGRIVTWQRDALGRVTTILTQADAGAAPVVVASDIVYEPFGPVSSLTFGNGVILSYSYDQDGRLTAITAGEGANEIQDLTLAYDDADNITAITDMLDAARSQTFQYDGLYRLTQAIGLYGTIDYDYDAVGNRTERAITDSLGTLTETYTYDTASNRLMSLTDGTTTQSFVYGASGQTTVDDRGAGADLEFVYDGSDRLVQLEVGGLPEASYRHNAFGERVAKELIGTNESTHFHYNPAGQLIAESDELGSFERGYIYLDGLPVAQIAPSSGGATQRDETLDNEDLGVIVQGNWASTTGLPGHEGADFLVHPGADPVPVGGTVLDNSSLAFSTTGLWPSSSALPGYGGSDYQSRSASGPFAPTLEIDNLAPAVTVAGPWNVASRTLGGHSGPNYLWRAPNGVSAETIYLDNDGPGFSTTGYWLRGTWTGGGGYYGSEFRFIDPTADPADTLIVDNSSPGFQIDGPETTDIWSSGSGPFDLDEALLFPGTSPDGSVIDYQTPGFSWTGSWWISTWTGGGRNIGPNFLWQEGVPYGSATHTATWTPAVSTGGTYDIYAWWNQAPDRASDATYTVHHAGGATPVTVNQRINSNRWNHLGTFTLEPGSNHRVALTNEGNGRIVADGIQFVPAGGRPSSVTWTPEFPSAQAYNVYAWWHASADRAPDAPYTIHHAAGSSEVVVDQRTNGGRWNLLGTYSFAPGTNHRVQLKNLASRLVAADAVRFAPVNPDPSLPAPTANWTPDIPETREYSVYAWWSAGANRPTDATYVVHHAGGTSSVVVDQTVLGGQWNLIGTYTFSAESDPRIELSVASGRTVADAIRMIPTDGAPNSVTWALNVPGNEYYRIDTRWVTRDGRATNAPYTVNHAGGSDTIPVDQAATWGTWVSLGSYLIPGDGSGSVVLTDQANGVVQADAVLLTADTSKVRTATWTYSAPESGNYRVFARWPEGPGHATNAKYRVQHTGGSSTVTVSQAQRGGQWNELGVFAFAGGSDYAITLSDDANGIVVADAVYIVKVEEFTDAVTWAPALPASGTYQVYAKWTSDETRATDALYRITHVGGTAEVSVNQRVGGGLWHYLGSYAFDPLTSPMVTLAANDNGSVAADAVRFVGGPGGAADIAYLHADHLGTPQAMTDATGQLLWWRDQTPFGQTVAEGGFSASPLRFPGQYADAESGLAYNYFRDYDPALGRYIQSDPIGLEGGLNTYAYVGGNPVNVADPTGTGPAGVAGYSFCDFFPCLTPDKGATSCPVDDDDCAKETQNAQRIYTDLVTKRIPQYLYGTRTGSADDGHLLAIRQGQQALRKRLQLVRLYCQVLPPEFPKWERVANQSFPERH